MILAISYLCSHAALYFASFHPHIRNFFMIASASITNLIFSFSSARKDYFFPFFGFASISPNRNLHCWWSFSIAVCVSERLPGPKCVGDVDKQRRSLLAVLRYVWFTGPRNEVAPRQVIWSPDDSFLAKILIFQLNLCFFSPPSAAIRCFIAHRRFLDSFFMSDSL